MANGILRVPVVGSSIVIFVVDVLHLVLEPSDALAKSAAQARDPFGTEDQDEHEENDQEFGQAERANQSNGHRSPSLVTSLLRIGRNGPLSRVLLSSRERVHKLPIGSLATVRLGVTFAALDDDQRARWHPYSGRA